MRQILKVAELTNGRINADGWMATPFQNEEEWRSHFLRMWGGTLDRAPEADQPDFRVYKYDSLAGEPLQFFAVATDGTAATAA